MHTLNRFPKTCHKSAVSRHLKWLSFVLAASLVLSAFATQTLAAGPEAKVKTAYLYTFLRSVTWAPDAFADDTAPFVVSIMGSDPLEGLLDMVAAKKTINKRKITILRPAGPAEYKTSHILYVTASIADDARDQMLDQTKGTSVMVVGETAGFAKKGAAINFYNDKNGTIGYEVNEAAATQQNLKLGDKVVGTGTPVSP